MSRGGQSDEGSQGYFSQPWRRRGFGQGEKLGRRDSMQRVPREDSEDIWEAVGIVGWLDSRVQEGMVRKLGGSEEAAR